ncbi:L,D-transpeptidase family protein [Zoogloea sp.]|uniref:L,D-transpeptidase family protein n=1 Tax=Zoogloea sp. TaxID=49181 RepID=UPI001ACFC812|nr:L,D-transpeptidase family protein [Zoogloea sp.]MBN8281670.1 L,D-transpeptidase family protein [Zoogloea sp.]
MLRLKAALHRGLALVFVCFPLVVSASGGLRASAADADMALGEVIRDIEHRRTDDALKKVDALLLRYPNFRLAHLIRGDLLLARTRPLSAFGDSPEAPAEKLADLREEAIARLKAYRNRPPSNYVPRYLLQMEPDQKFAIVVDTQRSRLYIYQNDNGRPRFVADYYIAHGKLGAEKTREGDKRTPVGVYHVTANLPRQKLSDFYGSGAFPINYPNEWDRQQGRNGHGIWLHGTPSDTYSRPPRASDGCVVLTNQDLDTLSGYLQVGLTPVIISNTIEWLSLDDWASERTALNREIEAWRKDWESRDVDRYLAHYSRSFRNNEGDYGQWAQQKRLVAAGKSWVKVDLSKLSVFRNPGKQDMIVVTFEQDYRSNNLSNVLKKRQYWVKEGGRWKIIYEGFA